MGIHHALIIDDNPNNIEVLNLLLQKEGVTSTTVQSLREAKQIIEEIGRVDVIFLDLEFPNGDGFGFFKELKLMPHIADVAVIAYSVHTSEIDKVRYAGFTGFLGKPLDMQRFPGQLKRILSGVPVWEV